MQQKLDPKKRVKPPGFAVADGPQNCGNCRHFDGKSTCLKYHYPVHAFNTCSAWEAKDNAQVVQAAPVPPRKPTPPQGVPPNGAAPKVVINVNAGGA